MLFPDKNKNGPGRPSGGCGSGQPQPRSSGLMHKKRTTERIARIALLIALAMIFSYVEAIIPLPVGIPGVKIGLANLAVVVALYLLGPREAFFISLLRILLTGFLFGSGGSILYSLAGGMLSFVTMLLLKHFGFSTLTVSMAGGLFHNVGQLIVACLVLESAQLLWYLPALMLAGFLAGTLIGLLSWQVIIRLIR